MKTPEQKVTAAVEWALETANQEWAKTWERWADGVEFGSAMGAGYVALFVIGCLNLHIQNWIFAGLFFIACAFFAYQERKFVKDLREQAEKYRSESTKITD